MTNLVLTSPTTLTFGDKEYKCTTGSGGFKETKVEGDKATPVWCLWSTVYILSS
jgi:L,D-peptidoglycan transpeptidase YkuD (ErfK/YbiS/YcfS/YnhG family)